LKPQADHVLYIIRSEEFYQLASIPHVWDGSFSPE